MGIVTAGSVYELYVYDQYSLCSVCLYSVYSYTNKEIAHISAQFIVQSLRDQYLQNALTKVSMLSRL